MIRYVFPESESVAQKNKKNKGSNYNTDWYKPKPLDPNKPPPKQQNNNSKPKQKEHDHCRDCGCKLEKKASRIWGICPSCDLR